MSKSIYKYTNELEDQIMLQVPKYSKFLSVKAQNNKLVFYFEVDTKEESMKLVGFTTFVTGGHYKEKDFDRLEFVDTIMVYDESIVLHIYKQV